MCTEYQIDIEYADGSEGKHLTYRFENAKLRNDVYHLICSNFINDQVDMEHLRKYGGVIVSTYNYREPVRNEMAQIVPNCSFKIEVLNELLEIVRQESINS